MWCIKCTFCSKIMLGHLQEHFSWNCGNDTQLILHITGDSQDLIFRQNILAQNTLPGFVTPSARSMLLRKQENRMFHFGKCVYLPLFSASRLFCCW